MHVMAGALHLGTSGFAYDEWKHGVFYPEGLKAREMLAYYSSQLSSVEINYTFRRFPTEKTLTTWRQEAAEGFVFTLKANQRITHSKRLRDADDDVRDFLDRAKLLGDRLGCVLFQCPPNLKYDRGLIESFVGYLPPGATYRDGVPAPVVEGSAGASAVPRGRLVRGRDGYAGPRSRRSLMGTLRLPALRKTEYTDDELKAWAARIGPAVEAGHDVFVYFKHEGEGASPKMAKRLEDILGYKP